MMRRAARVDGIYYGWWVLLAAGAMGFLGFGAIIPGFLVFALPIRGELDISSAQFAFVVGAAWAVGNVASLGAGWLADRYGGRRLVLIGGLLSCAGFGAVSSVNSYWQLLLAYAGVSAVGRGIGVVPNLMTIVNQWFIRRKALTMTLLNTAFAGGAALMVPLLAYCEGQFGWRATILGAGALVALLTAGAALVIRSRPEDLGFLPDGARPDGVRAGEVRADEVRADGVRADEVRAGEVRSDRARADGGPNPARPRRIAPAYSASDFTVRQAVATPTFWMMAAAVTLRISAADALVINQISMLMWKGIPEEQAAYYLSLTFLAIIPLRFAMGLAATVMPSRWLLCGGMAVGALGTVTFLLWSGYPAAAMFVLSIAATEGIATLGWLAVGEYFGRRSFGSLVGIMTVCFGVGSLAAPVAAGWVFDQTGTYATALLAAAPLQLASGLCYLLARRPAVPTAGKPAGL